MKSVEIINQKLSDPTWVSRPYSYADWFKNKLLDIGFYWNDDQPPHFCLQSGKIKITVSPYPNVVIVDKNEGSFAHELYCHPSIPQNEAEFDEFWNQIKIKDMKIPNYLQECLELNITLNCYRDLCHFHHWLQEASNWSSKNTHYYYQLDEWWQPYNQIIYNNLDKYGFVNGVGAPNDDAKIWRIIYGSDPCCSPNLNTFVSKHHASAHERNEVMILEIGYLCDFFQNKFLNEPILL